MCLAVKWSLFVIIFVCCFINICFSADADFIPYNFNSFMKHKSSRVESSKSKVEALGAILKKHVHQLRDTTNKQVDLIFLVDSSASVGPQNFLDELKFVKKLLADFTVDQNHTRVSVITFSSKQKVIRQVDYLSNPGPNKHKCSLLAEVIPKIQYAGGGTFTLGAFLEAKEVLKFARPTAHQAVFLITDGFSNGGDPRPLAMDLQKRGIKIFTFGIRNGNTRELRDIASVPKNETCYILDSFEEFEALARRALHEDLKMGSYTPEQADKCNSLCATRENCCDARASCMCGTHMGLYECICRPGYYGNGLKGGCQPCPGSTYKEESMPGDMTSCMRCPDENHTSVPGATSVDQCQCKKGYRSFNNSGCAALRCPKLLPPKNGYFVNDKCSNVFNAACGMRCNPGYQRRGSSLRICQEKGEFSGTATECIMKSCPPLPKPKNGNMICSRDDFSFDTVCRFTCDTGYKLVGSRKRTCLAIAFWTGITTRCREITCQPLPIIRDGKIFPAVCTNGEVSFGTTCQPSCHIGYTLIGPPTQQCTPDGIWAPITDGETSQCVDRAAPFIMCPDTIEMIADEDDNTAEINWDVPIAVDNSGYIPLVTSVPVSLPPKRFPIGKTIVTYSAEDLSSNKAKCNFTVTIVDKEPPRIDRCFSPLPIVSPEPYIHVTWDTPMFSDNSDENVTMERSHAPGLFPTGKTEVVYTAWDPSGNKQTCVLEINVIPHPCEYPAVPLNGNRTCFETPEGVHCRFACLKGYAFALPPADEYFCAFDNVWQPEEKIPLPDCTVRSLSNDVTQPVSLTFSGSVSCRQHRLLTEIEEDVQNKVVDRVTELCEESLTCRVYEFETTCEEEDDFNKVKIVLGRRKRSTWGRRSVRSVKSRTDSKNPDALVTFDFMLEGTVPGTGNRSKDRKLQGKLTANLKRILHTLREEASQGQFDFDAMHFTNMAFDSKTKKFRCKPGSVLMGNSCVKCPIGTFFNVITRQCQSCLVGTYQPREGVVTCLVCPQNTSTTKNQSKSELECKAQCLPGSFSHDGLEICETCQIGQYQDSYAQSGCLLCPDQKTTRRRGSRTKNRCKDKCPAGYVSKTGLEPCFACPKGTYQSEVGQSACFECPGNVESIRIASTLLSDCVDWDLQDDAQEDGQQQVEFNECFDVECHNGGSCVLQNFGFRCVCAPGYTGITCDLKINECDVLPCLNGGTCVDLIADYTCICEPGFTDKKCGINIDECLVGHCQNGGTCVDGHNSYQCHCAGGFQGIYCETTSDGCNSNPCLHNGTCVEEADGYECQCSQGISGVNCEIDIDECAEGPCQNGSTCVDHVGFYICLCMPGTSGKHCEMDINECLLSPCLEGATCYDQPGRYFCKCQPGFSGQKCETELDLNYMLDFPSAGSADYSKVVMEEDLSSFTLSFWMKSSDKNNYGTPVSYASQDGIDNALTLTDYNGFVIYVNGQKKVTDVEANDGEWHHIVVTWSSNRGTWKIYMDGLLFDSGFDLASSQIIKGGGSLVVGQEQDTNGAFTSLESFVGQLTQLNIWDEELSLSIIANMRISCEKFIGNVVAWPDIQSGLQGTVVSRSTNMCQDCPKPMNPLSGQVQFTSMSPGSFVTYSCKRGFILGGRNRRQCLVTGEWEGYAPTCQRIDCGFPGTVVNGYVEGHRYTFDNRVRYYCYSGYKRMGSSTRYCNEHGDWEGDAPYCEEITCELPSLSASTIVLSPLKRFHPDTSVNFECTPGNKMYTVHDTITCQADGTWDLSVPTCDPQTCKEPPQIRKATLSVQQDEYSVGYILQYACYFGYIFSENSLNPRGQISCLPTGQWELGNIPVCQVIECHDPPIVDHGDRTFDGVMFLTTATYTCHLGYTMHGNDLIECLEDGNWQPEAPTCRAVSCGRPEVALHGTVKASGHTFNSAAVYRCDQGYMILGETERTCLANTSWSGDLPVCKTISCGKPEHMEHGEVIGKDYILGSTVQYQCNAGFRLVGIPEINCREDGRWHGELPSCLQIQCDPPVGIDFGYYSGFSFYYGDSIQYECNEGYEIDGSQSLTCQSNREWSPEAPNCSAVQCQRPKDIRYGSVTALGLTYTSKAEYVCGDGYELEGDSVRVCQSDGSWSGQRPSCLVIKCAPPTGIRNGGIDYKDLKLGSVIRYFCNTGFELVGDEVRRCLHDLSWSGVEPRCSPVSCQEPDDIDNGIKIVTGVIFSAVVTYDCNTGYNIVGERSRTCTEDSTWSGELPHCEPVMCDNPTRIISNGRMFGDIYSFGSEINYECDIGYSLLGSHIRHCLANGQWDAPIPVCEIVHCPRLHLSHGSVSTFKTEYATDITFACYRGYTLVGLAEITCLSNGTWSGHLATCVKIECPTPVLSNGFIHVDGIVATYSCEVGHMLVGTDRRECQVDGSWDSIQPRCDPVSCMDLSQTLFNDGQIVSNGFLFGSNVEYVCNEGYKISGEAIRSCLASGEWAGAEPVCLQTVCSSPPPLSFGTWIGSDYTFNSTLQFACNDGYTLTGTSEITCLFTGQWSSGAVHCEMVTCPRPIPIIFGKIDGISNAYGSRIVYSCLLGFELIGENTRTCQQTGEWSGIEPICVRIECPVPEPLENGRIIGDTYTLGSSIRYVCHRGYELRGLQSRFCLTNKEWTGILPTCSKVKCPIPQQLNHGNIIGHDFEFEQHIRYTCNDGFSLEGDDTQTCLYNKRWSGEQPICKEISCGQPQSISHAEYRLLNNTVTFGSIANFVCIQGYTEIGWGIQTCTADGLWTEMNFICSLMECPAITNIEHGSVIGSEFSYGDILEFRCEVGYKLRGETTAHCGEGGWTHAEKASCEIITCPDPEPFPNGFIEGTDYFYDSEIIFRCQDKYQITFESKQLCSADGTWIGDTPVCQLIICRFPPEVSDGQVVNTSHQYTLNDNIEYSCNDGFFLLGDSILVCSKSGFWEGTVPSCERVNCPILETIVNGKTDVSSTTFESIATYYCNLGYELKGSSTRTCLRSGIWSGNTPSCEAVTCPPPDHVEHALISGVSFIFGDVVVYTCDVGYKLLGAGSHTCDAFGHWSEQLPLCQLINCGVPPYIENSIVTGNRYNFQDIVYYSCREGYELIGNNLIECDASGSWDGSVPGCRPITCGPPQVIPQATTTVTQLTYGSVAVYKCNKGYALTGRDKTTCLGDGSWDYDPSIKCDPINCDHPRIIPHGRSSITGTNYLSVSTYICDDGYFTTEETSVTCGAKGLWEGNVPTCLPVSCEEPILSQNLQVDFSDLTVGQIVTYSCPSGYTLLGKSTQTCMASGSWSGETPQCLILTCPEGLHKCDNGECIDIRKEQICDGILNCFDLSDELHCDPKCDTMVIPENVVLLHGNPLKKSPVNSNLEFSCEMGYVMVGEQLLTCTENGTWTSEPPACLPQSGVSVCDPFTRLPNTKPMPPGFQIGDRVRVQCEVGYISEGDMTATCLKDGTWTTPEGFCRKISCGKPRITDMINVIRVRGRSYLHGDTVSYKCRPGVPPANTPPIITCTEAGEWSGQIACAVGCKRSCLNGGMCIGMNRCKCRAGYVGSRCELSICVLPCLNNGRCSSPYLCSCPPGYEGIRCQRAICHEECRNGGRCTRPNRCECYNGFLPPFCIERSKVVLLPLPVNPEPRY